MNSTHVDPWRLRLEQLAQELFAFLVKEKGFVQPKPKRTGWATSFDYVSGRAQFGVEIQLDFRDDSVDVYLVKLHAGKLPQDGLMVKGETVRRSLALLLRDALNIHEERLDALFALYRTPMPWSEHVFGDVLRAASAVVERHVDFVIQQPMDVLFPPSATPRPSNG